jgi:hypothetical protein
MKPSKAREVVHPAGHLRGGDLNMIGQYTTLKVSRREFRLMPFALATLQLPQVEEARVAESLAGRG